MPPSAYDPTREVIDISASEGRQQHEERARLTCSAVEVAWKGSFGPNPGLRKTS